MSDKDYRSEPLHPVYRHALLIMQDVKERFYSEMMRHPWYVATLEKANDFLAGTMTQGEEGVSDKTQSTLLDYRGKAIKPDSIGCHHLIVLTGSSSLTLDMSPRDSVSYIIRTARGVKQALKQAIGDDTQDTPITIENGNRTSRWITRGDKYHLARNPDYYGSHVIPFAEEIFFPRVAKISDSGTVEPFTEEQVLANLRLNFLTYSYGAIRLKMAVNLTADYMRELGYDKSVIERSLRQVQALEIAGNYTRAIDDHHPPKHRFVSVGSLHDRYLIRGADFSRERALYQQGHYAIPMGDAADDNWHVWIDTMPRKVEIDDEGRRVLSAEKHGEKFTFSGHLLFDYLEALIDREGRNPAAKAAMLTLIKACETGQVSSFAEEYLKAAGIIESSGFREVSQR